MTEAKLKQALIAHHQDLANCQHCPEMNGPPVFGLPNVSPVLLLGQAPGPHEIGIQKPFAWTAGKTLFKWFEEHTGVSETRFRKNVYMAAVCRCFPGKSQRGGGDRVPNSDEIAHCQSWLQTEVTLLKPKLIIAVGKLAISQFLSFKKLTEVIGQKFSISCFDHPSTLIPLPHPSGASTWFRTSPGNGLLLSALALIASNQDWQKTFQSQ